MTNAVTKLEQALAGVQGVPIHTGALVVLAAIRTFSVEEQAELRGGGVELKVQAESLRRFDNGDFSDADDTWVGYIKREARYRAVGPWAEEPS